MKKDSSSKIIFLKSRSRSASAKSQLPEPPTSTKPEQLLYNETISAPMWIRLSVYIFFSMFITFLLIYPFLDQEANDLLHLCLCLVFALIVWFLHIFLVLNVSLTSSGVRFGFYIISQKVAYHDIISCKIYRYKLSDTLGWGIRKGPDGCTIYNVPGDQQISVRLVVMEDERRKEFAFSAKRPEVILKIIQSNYSRRHGPMRKPAFAAPDQEAGSA